MEPLASQFSSFLITVCIGLILGIIFDLYRIFRGFIRPKWYVTQIGDLIFWTLSTVIAFIILLYGNFGEVRTYVFIGFSLGLLFYFKLLSKKIQRLILKIIEIVVKTSLALFKLIMIPVRLIKRLILIPIGIISFVFIKINQFSKWLARKLFKPILLKYRDLRFKLKQKLKGAFKSLNPFKGKKRE